MAGPELDKALETLARAASQEGINAHRHLEIEFNDGRLGTILSEYATALVHARAHLSSDPETPVNELEREYGGLLAGEPGKSEKNPITTEQARSLALADLDAIDEAVHNILPPNIAELKKRLQTALAPSFGELSKTLAATPEDLPKRSDLLLPLLVARAAGVDSRAVVAEAREALKNGYKGQPKKEGPMVGEKEAGILADNAVAIVDKLIAEAMGRQFP